MIAVWAIAKTGAAFVPLDPHYPQSRIEFLLTDVGACLGVTQQQHLAALPAAMPWVALDDPEVAARMAAKSAEPLKLSRSAWPGAGGQHGVCDLHLRLDRHPQRGCRHTRGIGHILR